MNRRFVNLVVSTYRSKMHVLHRLDVSKHLFYPSTAEAEAAHAKEKERNNDGGGGGKPKPPRIERLQRLPPPIMGFESSPISDPSVGWDYWWPKDMFVLLHGGRGGEPSRILHANGAGHGSLYDVASRSVISVPDLGKIMGYQPIPFAIAGAAGEEEEGSLYVLCSNGYTFEVLDFSGGNDGSTSSRRRYGSFDPSSLKWQRLPLPPPPDEAYGSFRNSAVLDGGGTICVSTTHEATSTFCFDTGSREWWHAGDWMLPFDGRAEHVPELETWVGFSPDYPHHLCAADLSGITGTAPLDAPPALQYVWEDFNPPPTEETSIVLNKRFPGIVHRTTVEWSTRGLHLVNLGSGRFCVAKEFEAEETVSLSCCLSDDYFPKLKDRLTVLVGVEVVRDGGEGGLRMIKHKSKRFVFPGNRINWAL
ncbi:unnamed protein product [Urochloa humidicola]